MAMLIIDSGSTKCEWCVVTAGNTKSLFTQGFSPYFLSKEAMEDIIKKEVLPTIKPESIDTVFFYGTGCKASSNKALVKKVLQHNFVQAKVEVDHDLMGAAKALCGNSKGIACILGTGSNSCYFNGKKILTNSPGIGYILGDEGSGAYLGKKVLQYFLYKTFDDDLAFRFADKYKITDEEVLDKVYKQPLPNRYMASFTHFLAENRGHYMIENIIEDGLNDFFFQHICKYGESWTKPIHFVGGVAFGFKDVVTELCHNYEVELGNIIKTPMEGLVKYHLG